MTPARIAVLATLVAVAVMVAIQTIGAATVTVAAPLGLVSLQFTLDPGAAQAIVDSWVGSARTAALQAHALDVVLPCAYGTAVLAAGRALAVGRAAGTDAARTARRAGLLGVVAAVLDQIENAAMAVTLLDGASTGATLVTVVAAASKWGLLAASLAGLALVGWRTRPAAGSDQSIRAR